MQLLNHHLLHLTLTPSFRAVFPSTCQAPLPCALAQHLSLTSPHTSDTLLSTHGLLTVSKPKPQQDTCISVRTSAQLPGCLLPEGLGQPRGQAALSRNNCQGNRHLQRLWAQSAAAPLKEHQLGWMWRGKEGLRQMAVQMCQ